MTTTAQKLLAHESWPTILRFQRTAPVDVVGLAEALGLKVWEEDLPKDISGKIMLDPRHGGDAKYSIIINKNEPFLRKRFTVGHEIGHYILHRDKIGIGLTDNVLYRSGLTTLAEVHANQMSAEILMPFRLIEEAISAGATSVAEIADRLQVSVPAMSMRLQLPG